MIAQEFANSVRGNLIISQALCIAIEELKKVEPATMRENSNIEDMEFLRDNLFKMYPMIQEEIVRVEDS
tara:strand:+ start:16059 stop:16265 length:207 start_codon:yes stop_codon:yes gene_type:complete